MKALLALLFFVPVYIGVAFYLGWCASHIWMWHMVPLGLPVLGWKPLAMAGMLVSVLRMRPHPPEPEDARDAETKVLHAVGTLTFPLIAVGIAWVLR